MKDAMNWGHLSRASGHELGNEQHDERRSKPLVPDSFYNDPAMRNALQSFDMGTVIHKVRVHMGLSQEAFGQLIGLTQARVSELEAGESRIRNVTVVARVATRLGIPLRFDSSSTTDSGSSAAGTMKGEEVSWVNRRDFVHTVAAITLSVHAPGLERLETLLPVGNDPRPPRRIGAADVKAIEEATAAFRRFDYRHGGGRSRAAAVAQLGSVLKLQDSQCSQEVRSRLLLATADLARLAAWMTYDVEEHEASRRLSMIALETARRADHPHSADLIAIVQLNLAHQAVHLGRPQEALQLAKLGVATTATHPYPVSTSTRRQIAAQLAICQASLGLVEPCHRALDEVEELDADVDTGTAPPGATDMIPAEFAAKRGYAYHMLTKSAPSYAATAVDHLHVAVDKFGSLGPTYARSHALNLPLLAESYFSLREVEAAVSTGHEAVAAISTLSSTRAYTRLQDLARAAKPFSHQPSVAALRQQISTTLNTAP
jgi:transcriptional regulator with XRE-family HTH domain